MPTYVCECCLKEFSQKSHYNKHMNRKTPYQNNKEKIEKVVENIINKKLNINDQKLNEINMIKEAERLNKLSINNKYNFIEVCAGAGGLSNGFIDKGFNPILLNDTDKRCIETLELNHPKAKIFKGSMVDIDLEIYKKMEVDVLMGGVPCQSFSQAGKRKGISDDRGKLVLHFIKMIDTINPKIFLIENVQGLVTHEKGKTLKLIIGEINKLNRYDIQYKVLNANDYSVPQNRNRLIIVGVRKDLNKRFNFPTPHAYKPVLKDVLSDCPESPGAVYNQEKQDIMKLVPEGGCWVNIPIDIQKSYMGESYNSGGGKRGILKRLDMKKPSLTLLTTPSQKQTERCHPIETRPLQTLEYARIQTFPDDYKFTGSISQIYKQIGNAVPVNLAKAIAEEVLKVLQVEEKLKELNKKAIVNTEIMEIKQPLKYSELSRILTKEINKIEKKSNGIYFTPPETIYKNIQYLEPFMKHVKEVLEPSCGSCEYILALNKSYPNINITGIELNKTIFKSIKHLEESNIRLINDDYLNYKFQKKFDLIIGNPPYFVMEKKDVNKTYNDYFDGRPNIFILFIIKSLKLLNKNGIISFVLPKNFINCLYYDKTRKYINNNFHILNIIECNDNYIETKQDTIIIVLQNKPPLDDNNLYSINISDYTIFGTKDKIITLKTLYHNSNTLCNLDFSVSVGNVVWNQHKKDLTDDKDKTLLVYSSDITNNKLSIKQYSNKEKKNYINKKGTNSPLLVINRGYGVGTYSF